MFRTGCTFSGEKRENDKPGRIETIQMAHRVIFQLPVFNDYYDSRYILLASSFL